MLTHAVQLMLTYNATDVGAILGVKFEQYLVLSLDSACQPCRDHLESITDNGVPCSQLILRRLVQILTLLHCVLQCVLDWPRDCMCLECWWF